MYQNQTQVWLIKMITIQFFFSFYIEEFEVHSINNEPLPSVTAKVFLFKNTAPEDLSFYPTLKLGGIFPSHRKSSGCCKNQFRISCTSSCDWNLLPRKCFFLVLQLRRQSARIVSFTSATMLLLTWIGTRVAIRLAKII